MSNLDQPMDFDREVQTNSLNNLQSAVLHESWDGTTDKDFTIAPYERRPRGIKSLTATAIEIEDARGTKIVYPVVVGEPLYFQPSKLIADGTNGSVIIWW